MSNELQAPFSLSAQQQAAVSGIINKEIRILVGSAGTGKSEVVAAVESQLGDSCLVITPTHKALLALREKGVERVNIVTGLFTHKAIQARLSEKGVTHIIVDEASMIDRDTMVRLRNFIAETSVREIHVCFVGDPLQLPPVSAHHNSLENDWFPKSNYYFKDGIFILTEGYRQSADVKLEIVTEATIDPNSVAICMTNAMRNKLNLETHVTKYGKTRAFTSVKKAILQLHAGDRLVCYSKDDHNQTYRNNCTYTIRKVEHFDAFDEKSKVRIPSFKIWFENGSRKAIVIPKQMFSVKHMTNPGAEKRDWELAYALTCHAAQGSGFDDVTVHLETKIDEFGDVNNIEFALQDVDPQRWLYTAVTRGKKNITVVDPANAIQAHNLSLDMSIRQSFGTEDDVVEPVEPTKTVPASINVVAPQEAPQAPQKPVDASPAVSPAPVAVAAPEPATDDLQARIARVRAKYGQQDRVTENPVYERKREDHFDDWRKAQRYGSTDEDDLIDDDDRAWISTYANRARKRS